jgi:hypothetical protein
MKTSLNKLGVATFQRKANKMKTVLIDCTSETLDLDRICNDWQVYAWSWETAFVSNLNCSGSQLGSVLSGLEFDCKSHISHVGLYDESINTFLLYRLYVGQISGWSYDIAFYENQKSELPFLQAGQTSWL